MKSEGTYKVAFENDSKTYKDMLSPTNRWLFPNAYLRIFGKKLMKDIGFDADKPKSGTKSKIPKKRMEQIEQYIDEIDDNTKQFPSVLNELPTTSEDNQDNIMLQDIITKNEIATDNSMKLIETSLTEIGEDASTQTGGLPLRELEGLDKELRMISGSLRSAIARSIAKQVDIDKENRKLEEMANDETYSDEQREEVRARLQWFQDEQKAINDQIRILKGRYSNQIYQIRESIMKFLDKETGTLGERIRSLFREQGMMIISILTALWMTLGVLIEALSRRSRVKISANQRTLPSVLFLSLLFHHWLEVIHLAFHYVNLLNMCSKQMFHSTNLSNVGFFIASQSVRIYLSFQKKPITK